MTVMNSTVPEVLSLRTVREVLLSPGPCVTVLLPAYRPGEPSGSPAALLKSNIREAARQLGQVLPQASISMLLKPLEQAAADPDLERGSHWGRAILRSPQVFDQFELTQPASASLAVAGSFAVRRVAGELVRPERFLILSLSKTKIAALRCEGFHLKQVSLPHGIPENLADALALEPPDHDLENRSSSGKSTGAMHGIRFGTGSGRETQHAHLGDFYKMVDRGVHELARDSDMPLILAGVDEDTTIYRAVSNYPHLAAASIASSPDGTLLSGQSHRDRQEVALQEAYGILRDETLRRHIATLASAQSRIGPARFSTNPDLVLHAAFEGRIGQLYVNQTAERLGVFERGQYHSWGEEDLLNLAMVQTMIHNGEVSVIPAESMPDGAAVAAMMRY